MVNKFRLDQRVSQIVVEMLKLSNAYIEFAYTTIAKKNNSSEGRYDSFLIFLKPIDWDSWLDMFILFSASQIPAKCSITKIVNFENILCPTITLPVSKNAVYDNIIGEYLVITVRMFCKICEYIQSKTSKIRKLKNITAHASEFIFN